MTATKTIIAELSMLFAPMDAEVAARSQEWAKGRCEALRTFLKSDEAKALRNNAHAYYTRRFAICGGKTWHGVFVNGWSNRVSEIMAKNCAAVAESRNASIARKLDKAGVTTVKETKFTKTRDGFNGYFVVDTDAGEKRISVDTIYAGGYNIQCLHLRVLVKVK